MNKKIGVLIYEHLQPMDFNGPWEVLSIWKNNLNAPIDLYLISETGSDVQCDSALTVKSHVDFEHCPALDYLIVPGGRGRLKQVNNPKIINFITQQAAHNQLIISVCTGMFLLHQTGLLKNRSATTYWRALPELQQFGDVNIVEDRVVKSGRIWTAGGISSGIDLAFELIAEIAGKETAGQVQLLFEYFPNNNVYCSLNTANTLPPYHGSNGIDPVYVPEYIENYIEEKNKKE